MNLVARPWIIFFILSYFVISSSVGRPIQYSSDAIEEWKKTDEADRAQRYLHGALRGDSVAQFNLGLCYERGIGVAVNYSEAVKWYQKSADQDNADGQASLAGCYYFGIGVIKDEVEAYAYYSLASRSMEKAKKPLSLLAGKFTFEKLTKAQRRAQDLLKDIEVKRAAKLVGTGRIFTDNKAKADAGDAVAQGTIGYCYHNAEGVARDYAQAVYWFRKSADQGNAESQSNLGWCYYQGEGVPRDYAHAVFWYRKAADQGLDIAQTRLGSCLVDGIGVTKDPTQGVSWYRKAAEQGEPYAQANLGHCYFEGNGVAKDYVQGALWLRKAAEQGHPSAQFSLGERYENGDGVERDKVEAYAYYNVILANELASGTSFPQDARERLSSLEKTMSKGLFGDDIAAGQKRTKELQKEIDAKIAAKKAGK